MAGEAAAVAPSSGPIQRPAVLKGLHYATVKRNLFAAIGSCIVVTIAYKILVNDPKKRDYAEFYKSVFVDFRASAIHIFRKNQNQL